MSSESKPTTRRYSPEFKERAVRMVRQLRKETGEKKGTIGRVADQVGVRCRVVAYVGEASGGRRW